jgi:hypothetical protein
MYSKLHLIHIKQQLIVNTELSHIQWTCHLGEIMSHLMWVDREYRNMREYLVKNSHLFLLVLYLQFKMQFNVFAFSKYQLAIWHLICMHDYEWVNIQYWPSERERLWKRTLMKTNAYESERLWKRTLMKTNAYESERLWKRTLMKTNAYENERLWERTLCLVPRRLFVKTTAMRVSNANESLYIKANANESERLWKWTLTKANDYESELEWMQTLMNWLIER